MPVELLVGLAAAAASVLTAVITAVVRAWAERRTNDASAVKAEAEAESVTITATNGTIELLQRQVEWWAGRTEAMQKELDEVKSSFALRLSHLTAERDRALEENARLRAERDDLHAEVAELRKKVAVIEDELAQLRREE